MTLQHTLPLLEVRSHPQGVVEGYASVFNGIDAYGDSIAPGAYAATLKAHGAGGTKPAMLWMHKPDAPIGHWQTIEEDRRGLRVEGKLNLKTSAGQEAFEHLRAGDVGAFSIGYVIPRGGFEVRGDVRVLTQVDLREISVVTLPADPQARVTSVKTVSEKPSTIREFELALFELGFSRRQARHIACKGFADMDPEQQAMEQLHPAALSLNQLLKAL